MTTEEFTGHVSAMRADNEFLGAEDLVDRGDMPVQIAKCNRCLKRKACGKMVDEMYTLSLLVNGKPAKKEWWIKATNRQQITKMYGGNVGDWKGKWLWLYVTEVKSPAGGMTLGIRIRDRKDAPQTNSQPRTPPPDRNDLPGQNDPYQGLQRRIHSRPNGSEASMIKVDISDTFERGEITREESDELHEMLRKEMA